ncbi:polysaccharide deacetylase family protein [Effusibacillus consociatus]|uniref:Polysaccharide deacetylase family protein n=1 Tax=Effusibacillus consociatus TaxID=1117041 RepID=A0ABV9Q7Z3_9BACL
MHDWNDDRVIVKNQQPEVVLTFDDGPTRYLPELLTLLKKENVQAVFFWQTSLVDVKKPWIQVLDEGHLIGSHGHSHRILTKLSYEEQLREIHLSKEKLESLTGKSISWFRPAYGLYNEDTIKIAQRLNLEVVLWQIASWDWMHKKDEIEILDNVLENVAPGDIVLLHELPQTLKILPDLIQGIRAMGMKFSLPHTQLSLEHYQFPMPSKE